MKIINKEIRNVEIHDMWGPYYDEVTKGIGYYYTLEYRTFPWIKKKNITIPILVIGQWFSIAKEALKQMIDPKLVFAINKNPMERLIPFDFFYSQLQESVKEEYIKKWGYKKPDKYILKAFGIVNDILKNDLEIIKEISKCRSSINNFAKHVGVIGKDGEIKQLQ